MEQYDFRNNCCMLNKLTSIVVYYSSNETYKIKISKMAVIYYKQWQILNAILWEGKYL